MLVQGKRNFKKEGEWFMGIFYNNYQRLLIENKIELAKLPESDWNVLGRMMEYMSSFRLSRFELEVLKKDLIGMAEEAQLERSTLSDKIGMPEKEFCDRLIESAGKRSIMERMFPFVRNIILVMFLFYTLDWLFEGRPDNFGITSWVFLAAGVIPVMGLVSPGLEGRSVYLKKWKRHLAGVFCLVLLIALQASVNVASYFGAQDMFLITGKGTGIFAVLLILLLVGFFGNNYFWDRCSRKYRWK